MVYAREYFFRRAWGGYAYFTFDNAVIQGVAQAALVGFVADLPGRGILDAAQCASALRVALMAGWGVLWWHGCTARS